VGCQTVKNLWGPLHSSQFISPLFG